MGFGQLEMETPKEIMLSDCEPCFNDRSFFLLSGAGFDYFNVTNGFERSNFISALRERKFVRGQNEVIDEAILYRYTDWNHITDRYRNRRMFVDMISDSLFVAPGIKTAGELVKKSVVTYMYHLEHRLKTFYFRQVPSWVGTFHVADLPILFGQPFWRGKSPVNTKEGNYSRAVIRLWTNFAKTGYVYHRLKIELRRLTLNRRIVEGMPI